MIANPQIVGENIMIKFLSARDRTCLYLKISLNFFGQFLLFCNTCSDINVNFHLLKSLSLKLLIDLNSILTVQFFFFCITKKSDYFTKK